ncbi:hypothetical protein MATR_06760 [Marivirga tractuosa]|uniref:Uncharacterized protein n=1 Tax=Marivirga tractuosa (strain ATCC 23168 / DSM 4126 / NBRC 15989 / NCIMB 1408 / VKM B-1430 / H-43) TaxID=643867 RepID=E4TQZ1_MARTH|nr:hypothetical protein [Marivirga tractuosa]ADR21691.1 hypothetical protein Ftrac_1703 [Marivirga tractuosa DSM 4126]BDD13851.1 hypothetical protein MATR_06760 [Marivirga tractuosa]
MQNKELTLFRILFIISAIWNLIGAIFGYFNTAHAFEFFFNRELTDPLYYSIYQGAWGTTLVYFIGYSIVAYNPLKHTGIVIVGGIGKVGFAISLLKFYLSGIAGPIVFVVIIGDLIFGLLFLYYIIRLYKTKQNIL